MRLSALSALAVALLIATSLPSFAQLPHNIIQMDPAQYDTLYSRDIFSDIYLPTQNSDYQGIIRTEAQIKFKGHSTRYHPKKSYRLKSSSNFQGICQTNLNSIYQADDLYTAADLTVQPDSLLKLYYTKGIGDASDYSDLSNMIFALNDSSSSDFPRILDSLLDVRARPAFSMGPYLSGLPEHQKLDKSSVF